jgi:hypothetical protein
MKKIQCIILLLLFLAKACPFSYSQFDSSKPFTKVVAVALNDNLYSFLQKEIYDKDVSKDSIVSVLSNPLSRIGVYYFLSQKYSMGRFDEFEWHLGIKPTGNDKILRKYLSATGEQREILKKKTVVREYAKRSPEVKETYQAWLASDFYDSDEKTPTCFRKPPTIRCLEEGMSVKFTDAPIRQYPFDTSQVIYVAKDSTINTKVTVGYDKVDGWYQKEKHGYLLTSEAINGFYKVKVLTDGEEVQGWVCGCFIEIKPTPQKISPTEDTLYYKILIDEYRWKEYCDTASYSINQMAELYQFLGLAYLEAKEDVKAIKWLTEANKLVKCTYCIGKRAIAKHRLGDYVGSNADLEKLHLNSDGYCDGIIKTRLMSFALWNKDLPNYWLLRIRAYNYMNLKINDKALLDLNSSIRLRPEENAESYYHRGIIKFNSGNRTGGCKDFSIAGEQGYDEAYQTIRDNCNN